MPLKRGRDKKRFRELTFPHLKFLYNLALKYTGKNHSAEDLVQETMYTAFKNFHQLRHDKKVKGWLVSILRNIYLREIEKNARKDEVDIEDTPGMYMERLRNLSGYADPEESFLRKTEALEIQAIIDKLPERYKTPLLLFYMQGASYREISSVLNIPIGTVMSSISRAKAFVKRELLRLYEEKNMKVINLYTIRKIEGK